MRPCGLSEGRLELLEGEGTVWDGAVVVEVGQQDLLVKLVQVGDVLDHGVLVHGCQPGRVPMTERHKQALKHLQALAIVGQLHPAQPAGARPEGLAGPLDSWLRRCTENNIPEHEFHRSRKLFKDDYGAV